MSSDKPPSSASRTGRDLTTGSIPRHLVAFSIPMLAGSLLQTAYSFINAIWVGQFLGKNDLAAVTVSFPVVFVLMSLAGGLTLAANILVSQYYGARDGIRLRKVVHSSLLLIGSLSIVLFVIGEVFTPHILQVMDTPPEVLGLAASYMRVFLIALPFAFSVFLTSAMLRGIGDSTTPLYFQAASVLLAAALDPLLMFGLLGMPKLGLNGTAWASVITQAGAAIGVLWYMQWKRCPVTPEWRHLRFDPETAWHTVKIGLPSAAQQSLVSVSMVFVIGIVNRFGANATAAFGAASRIDQLAFLPAQTVGMAMSTLAGQNIGARRHERVKQTFNWGVLFSVAVTLLPSLLAVTVPHLLLRIFINDADVIRIGVGYLRIVGATYVMFAVLWASNGVINGAGHTFMTTIISFVGLWLLRVPLAYLLSSRMHSVRGVWLAMIVGSGIGMLISIWYYYSGRWKGPEELIHQLPPVDPTGIIGEEAGEL